MKRLKLLKEINKFTEVERSEIPMSSRIGKIKIAEGKEG
jgi:hypothetical protein